MSGQYSTSDFHPKVLSFLGRQDLVKLSKLMLMNFLTFFPQLSEYLGLQVCNTTSSQRVSITSFNFDEFSLI